MNFEIILKSTPFPELHFSLNFCATHLPEERRLLGEPDSVILSVGLH